MKNYPKASIIRKKEQAFLKGLKPFLSKQYSYMIVGNKGFNNDRFIRCCQEHALGHLIRTTLNRAISLGECKGCMYEVLSEDRTYQLSILLWKKDKIMRRCLNEKDTRYMVLVDTLNIL